jgi:hypothetical protein
MDIKPADAEAVSRKIAYTFGLYRALLIALLVVSGVSVAVGQSVICAGALVGAGFFGVADAIVHAKLMEVADWEAKQPSRAPH